MECKPHYFHKIPKIHTFFGEFVIKDLKSIYKFCDKLVGPDNVLKIASIGKSIEKRDIRILKINADKSDLPLVFIDAGQC